MDLSHVVRANGAIAVLLAAEILAVRKSLERGRAFDGVTIVGMVAGVVAMVSGSGKFLWLSALGVYMTAVRCGGSYCGGADSMQLYTLIGVGLSATLPFPFSRFGLALVMVQVTLSYAIAAYVKVTNPEWRSGRAVAKIPDLAEYEVPARWSRIIKMRSRAIAWLTIGLEAVLAGGLWASVGAFHPWAVGALLGLGAAFHLGNFVLLGLNRFFWSWTAAYAVVWHFLETS